MTRDKIVSWYVLQISGNTQLRLPFGRVSKATIFPGLCLQRAYAAGSYCVNPQLSECDKLKLLFPKEKRKHTVEKTIFLEGICKLTMKIGSSQQKYSGDQVQHSLGASEKKPGWYHYHTGSMESSTVRLACMQLSGLSYENILIYLYFYRVQVLYIWPEHHDWTRTGQDHRLDMKHVADPPARYWETRAWSIMPPTEIQKALWWEQQWK